MKMDNSDLQVPHGRHADPTQRCDAHWKSAVSWPNLRLGSSDAG